MEFLLAQPGRNWEVTAVGPLVNDARQEGPHLLAAPAVRQRGLFEG